MITFNSYLSCLTREKVSPVIRYFCCLAVLLYLQSYVKNHILDGTPHQYTQMWFIQLEQTV